jgi:L-2-hydroxyglutarate oxidase LhgO
MEEIDCVVVGAGVIGLSIARALALRGREVLIIESETHFGSITSSRNSGVIHAGIYYPAGSLKASHCLRGRQMLYRYCDERHIPYQRCGKLIVATREAEVQKLLALQAAGKQNGVTDLELLTAATAQRLEPALQCHAALISPSTGIIDSHAYMIALLADAESGGAQLVVNTPVIGGTVQKDGIALQTGGADPAAFLCRTLVNCAGLTATALARELAGFPVDNIPPAYYAKGCYFALSGRAPFRHLVYPVPVPGGLGIHLTLDLAGQARFGPNVHWIPSPEYSVDPHDADAFYAEVRRYWPALRDGTLRADYAGVRPKVSGPREPAADFMIQGEREHGVPGLVNLFGIESPGLTASMSIAESVAEMVAPLRAAAR